MCKHFNQIFLITAIVIECIALYYFVPLPMALTLSKISGKQHFNQMFLIPAMVIHAIDLYYSFTTFSGLVKDQWKAKLIGGHFLAHFLIDVSEI